MTTEQERHERGVDLLATAAGKKEGVIYAQAAEVGDLPWYAIHANLVTLTRHLASEGYSADEIPDAVEKPWHYEDEWRDALAAAKAEAAS